MKNKLDFSQFFIKPDAWDSVITIDQKNPIDEFNKLNMKTQFDESLNPSSLNQFFQELITYIKTENIHYVNNLVFGFIPILLNYTNEQNNIIIDSAFFQISKQMFNKIYQKSQKYTSILIAVSLFDILTSDLPISISYAHLFHIQEEQAKLIHKYLHDGNDYSLPTKCLAASLAFPSSRFNESNPSYQFYLDSLASIDQTRLQFLPDPQVMLAKSMFFSSSELIFASFVVQYSNSLTFSIGLDQINIQKVERKTALNMNYCCSFQSLITSSELTIGALCHSIRIHSVQPGTISVLHNFFRAFDCVCGIELIKELFLLNTTLSFTKLIRSLGATVLIGVFKEIEAEGSQTCESLLDVVLPFHANADSLHQVIDDLVKMTKTDEDRQKVLRFLGSLHSVFLRFFISDLSSTYTVIVEHFIGISFVVHSFLEMLTLQPQFDKFEVTHLSLRIISLIYSVVERFSIKSLSNRFIHGTFECIMYLMNVPVDSVTFLLFDVEDAYFEIRNFAESHSKILCNFMKSEMPDILLPAAAVVCTCFRDKSFVDLSLLIRITKYACMSYVPQVFYAAKSCIRSFCSDSSSAHFASFCKIFFDLYFSIISPTPIHDSETDSFIFNPKKIGHEKLDAEVVCHIQTLYLLLLVEVLKSRDDAAKQFLSHPVFESFYGDAQKQFDVDSPSYVSLLCPFVEIVSILWRQAGSEFDAVGINVMNEASTVEVVVVGEEEENDQISIEKVEDNSIQIPLFSKLLENIQFLWAPTASSLLYALLEIVKRLHTIPYQIKIDLILESPAENSLEFVSEIHKILPDQFPEFKENESNVKSNESAALLGPADCGFPWLTVYEYDFIIQQKPLVFSQRNFTLPNSQIIEEDENEEEEEEEEKEESSEF